MRRTIHVLLAVLALGVAGVGAAGKASAATAVPWAFAQVEVSGTAPSGSVYVPLTANCPSGFTPPSAKRDTARKIYNRRTCVPRTLLGPGHAQEA